MNNLIILWKIPILDCIRLRGLVYKRRRERIREVSDIRFIELFEIIIVIATIII
jgi:hypothetical protein